MPLSTFLVLNSTIKKIQAENTFSLAHAVFYANNPGKGAKEYKNFLQGIKNTIDGTDERTTVPIKPGITPGVQGMDSEDVISQRSERGRKIREDKERRKSLSTS